MYIINKNSDLSPKRPEEGRVGITNGRYGEPPKKSRTPSESYGGGISVYSLNLPGNYTSSFNLI